METTICRPQDVGEIQIVFPPSGPRAKNSGNNHRKGGGYTAKVQNIYGAPPPSTEEHHEVIKDIQTIMQWMWTQTYELEGLAQANAVLTISNSAVMAQLSQTTVTMNDMQAQLKTLTSAQSNQARPKINFYFWSCGRNFTHGRKTCS